MEQIFSQRAGFVPTSECGGLPDIVRLMGLAAGPERRNLAAARHSENTDDFSGGENGPVNGLSFRHSGSGAGIGSFSRSLIKGMT
jgi:hypothetical protein